MCGFDWLFIVIVYDAGCGLWSSQDLGEQQCWGIYSYSLIIYSNCILRSLLHIFSIILCIGIQIPEYLLGAEKGNETNVVHFLALVVHINLVVFPFMPFPGRRNFSWWFSLP